MPVEIRRAVRIVAFGGPQVMRLETLPLPTPGPGQLLVRNRAAGLNPVDYKIRAGHFPVIKPEQLPYVLGRDVAGEVVACGPSAQRFKPGDLVYAMPGLERGAYSNYVLVKETEAAAKPVSLDDVAAGATPLAALTAWQGLFRHGGLKAGQRALIHGGSGGVGHFAIQLAKAKGARVITTVSGRNVEFARELGADEVIDYKSQRFEDDIAEVDLVLDLIGGETQERSWSVLKRGGALVSTLKPPSQEKAAEHGARGLVFMTAESGAELAEIGSLIDAGQVKPVVVRTFLLAQAAEALGYLEHERPAGKVVLVVD